MNTDVIDRLAREAFGTPFREKSAAPMGLLRGIGNGIKTLFTRGVPAVSHANGSVSAATRALSVPRSLMSTAALGGAGAVGYGHLANNASATEGTSWNPLTWGGGQTRQQMFDRNLQQVNSLQTDANKNIDEGYLHQNDPGFGGWMHRMTHSSPEDIQTQLDNQSYTGGGGFGPSLGGLNPFAAKPMSSSADLARSIQSGDTSRLDAMQTRMRQRGAQMNPAVRSQMESQMSEMRGRINTSIPGGGGGGGGNNGGGQTGNWQNHMQVSPQQLGYYLNPHDYRNNPQSSANIPWEQLAASGPLNLP